MKRLLLASLLCIGFPASANAEWRVHKITDSFDGTSDYRIRNISPDSAQIISFCGGGAAYKSSEFFGVRLLGDLEKVMVKSDDSSPQKRSWNHPRSSDGRLLLIPAHTVSLPMFRAAKKSIAIRVNGSHRTVTDFFNSPNAKQAFAVLDELCSGRGREPEFRLVDDSNGKKIYDFLGWKEEEE